MLLSLLFIIIRRGGRTKFKVSIVLRWAWLVFKRVTDDDNTWYLSLLMRYGIQSGLKSKYSIRNVEFDIPSKYTGNIRCEELIEIIYLG